MSESKKGRERGAWRQRSERVGGPVLCKQVNRLIHFNALTFISRPPQSPCRPLNNSSSPSSNLLDSGARGGCWRAKAHTSFHSFTSTRAQEHKADEEWLTARGGSDYSFHTTISSRLKDLFPPTAKFVSLRLRRFPHPHPPTSPLQCFVFKIDRM